MSLRSFRRRTVRKLQRLALAALALVVVLAVARCSGGQEPGQETPGDDPGVSDGQPSHDDGRDAPGGSAPVDPSDLPDGLTWDHDQGRTPGPPSDGHDHESAPAVTTPAHPPDSYGDCYAGEDMILNDGATALDGARVECALIPLCWLDHPALINGREWPAGTPVPCGPGLDIDPTTTEAPPVTEPPSTTTVPTTSPAVVA